MKKAHNREKYLKQLQAKEVGNRPLKTSIYLGFLLPSNTVVMRRIEDLVNKSKPYLVACPVTKLFE